MNDDLEAQFRQIYEEMDYFENPPLAFPKLGGAYDTYSLLIFTLFPQPDLSTACLLWSSALMLKAIITFSTINSYANHN